MASGVLTVTGVPIDVKQQTTGTQDKPLVDEEPFQQLLGAAFVLQEHNDRLLASESKLDPAQALSEIVETQKLLQTQQLDLPAALELIAERAQRIAHATGAAIGMVEEGRLIYRAGTGSAANEVGVRTPLDTCLAADCLHNGQILQCSDVKKDLPRRSELCQDRGIQSLLAAPVYREGKVAGVLELRFAKANDFQEHDVRTSQLMAGLVTEAMARANEMEWKQTLAAERATMLQALERIKPQLERLVSEPPAASDESTAVPAAKPEAASVQPAALVASEPKMEAGTGAICRGCGRPFGPEEYFCGICGVARSTEGDIQSKWASLWHMQQAAERKQHEKSVAEPPAPAHEITAETGPLPAALEEMVARFKAEAEQEERSAAQAVPEAVTVPASHPLPPELKEIVARFADEADTTGESEADFTAEAETGWRTDLQADLQTEDDEADSTPPEVPLRIVPADVPSETIQRSPWTSAARAREWLESAKTQQRPRSIWLANLWNAQRANIYLGASALLLVIVLFGWDSRPAPDAASSASQNATLNNRRRKNPPKPKLTLFEQLLVSLGLAEPPPVPVYLGNPDTQVWVDLHTALYYCPGADLYGKTAGGRFTTQQDAQRDQFEPAFRKACD